MKKYAEWSMRRAATGRGVVRRSSTLDRGPTLRVTALDASPCQRPLDNAAVAPNLLALCAQVTSPVVQPDDRINLVATHTLATLLDTVGFE